MEINPIGRVEETTYEHERGTYNHSEVKESIAVIGILPEFKEQMDGLEKENEVTILYWMHGLSEEDRRITKVHPKGIQSLPLVGVFATRSPMRPNPIGVSKVELLEVNGNRIKVKGLDARKGSPVLDIKARKPGVIR